MIRSIFRWFHTVTAIFTNKCHFFTSMNSICLPKATGRELIHNLNVTEVDQQANKMLLKKIRPSCYFQSCYYEFSN